ncbi:MAG: CRISPR-associated endoribonuclease Cas6 [Syntrophomonadaceae bacterium]|nr:CRISPR-associated endoribonuclease Cas6 [Syntrophomonadaceae bacterium]
MRITIELYSSNEIILPIHYNYILQGFLYKNLTDKNYRTFLHETGYQIADKSFKLFTYSRLMGKFRMLKDTGIIAFSSPITLVVAAGVEPFITDLAETLIKSEHCYLGDNPVEIKSISVHRKFTPTDNVQIKMLSPMVTYKTIVEGDKKQTEYYSPWQKEFGQLVASNLLKKYQIIHGDLPENKDFRIIPNGMQEQKFARIINYKGTYIKAYAGIYWLKGNPDLIEIAYNTGLGSKNSQGFGCFEVVG